MPHAPTGYGQDYDPEDPEVKGFDFTDESIRKGFIRKVYSILMVISYIIRRVFSALTLKFLIS